ncbi:MAG: phage major capsid protein [Desulfobacula sp.]|uniref:phage major capsid protein n=1 Tax=Desulfobacula sp. TaxID=2593537 RepID=UPI0039B87EBF|nr:phage major capsid protein [Desulfobacula sp.]
MATIGDTGAPSTNTIYYDALLSTTLAAYRKTLYDNIFKDSAFLAFLRLTDSVRKQNGGERVAMPLMYGKNETVKVVGGYEVLDTTPQDGMTTAFSEWAEIAGTISISRKEERQNAGEGRILNLLESKTKQAEMTMREELNSGLLLGKVSSSTFVEKTSVGGSFGLVPLGMFFRKLNATDPTTNNIGNISAASHDWWRHRTGFINNETVAGQDFKLSISTYAGFELALRRMYNFCSRGSGGSPDLCVMDQVSFETYENALSTKVRYANTKMADMGFDNIKLRGATVIWDESVPDIYTGAEAITVGSAFFINTNFYNLIIDSETDIVTTPFIEPENQTAKTAKILFMGQSAVSNMRKHGVIGGIAQDIAA